MGIPLRVLILEDSEDDTALILRELRRSEYDPKYLRVDSPEALAEALSSQSWDLIIADYAMPRFSAPVALAMVQNQGIDLPFIVVSGAIGEDTAVAMMKFGAHDYMMKSKLARLGAAVRRELQEAVVRAERNQAQTVLRQTRADLERAQQVAQLGSWVGDLGGRLVSSKENLRIFGMTEESYDGRQDSLFSLVHPDDRLAHLALRQAAIDGKAPYSMDCRILRADGSLRWAHIEGVVEQDEAGRPLRLVGTTQDITDRKQTEELLRQSQTRFMRLAESGIIGILIADVFGNIKEANDTFLKMVGYSREELLSGQLRWAEMTPPEWWQLDELAAEELKTRGSAQPWEKEYIRKDGTRVPILVGVAMLDEANYISFVLDITERKRLEEIRTKSIELEEQSRRAQEANRLKGEFLANMSHELRTPLNAIIGFAELMHDGRVGPVSAQHKEYLGDILTSGWHLLTLINDVLDLSKIEAGRIEFRPQPIELAAVVGEVRDTLREVAAKKAIQISIEVDSTLTQVVADPARLKQVLYNYLSNAIKFNSDGGRVAVRALTEGEQDFRLEVEDSGAGIRAEDLGRLFMEFQQLDSGTSKKHAGTGLGLALTKRIVGAQGGRVGVRSSPGEGSTFFAVLPRVARASGEVAPVCEIAPFLVPRLGAPTILVVEDEPRDSAWLVRTLTSAGYAVQPAETGAEAVARAREHRFDAVTLDVLLPDANGIEVARQIRADPRHRDVPIILVTVVAGKGVAAGFPVRDVLLKPVTAEQLLVSLERARVPPDGTKKILVVDDDPHALKLMEAMLKQLGFVAVCRSNGPDALETTHAEYPAAVILDLMMPEMDGFQFLEQFRRTPVGRQIPVLLWTVKDLSATERGQLLSQVQGFISKGPRGGASLVEELRGYLGPRAPKLQVDSPAERIPVANPQKSEAGPFYGG